MTTFNTSRKIPATPEQIFAAFSDPKRLAKWWGPAGFTNSFEIFEFKKDGQWEFIMHGPDGQNYPNKSIFTELEPNKKVAIQHISEPKFLLTITLEQSSENTLVSWSQKFENAEIASKVEHIVVPSNEQNLDRLREEVING
jgi:uncharacterized protein YndB with AHSA1/START domain